MQDETLQAWIGGISEPCWVSTMTTCIRTTIDTTRERMQRFHHPRIHVRVPGGKRTRKSTFRSFANSISCVVQHPVGACTVKLFFSNGTLHVTGAKSVSQSMTIMEYFATELGGSLLTSSFTVQLMNIVIKNPQYETSGLCLHTLCSECSSHGYKSFYDPDLYVGMKIKVPSGSRCLTALCFNRGCIILTGIKEPSELLDMNALLALLRQFMKRAENKMM